MIYIETLNDYEKVRGSCKIFIVLFAIAFLMIFGFSSENIYFHWYLKKAIRKQQCIKHINDKYHTI